MGLLAGCGAVGDMDPYSAGQSASEPDASAEPDAVISSDGWVPFESGDGPLFDPDSGCAHTSLESERVPLDMMFMVDTSGSMKDTKLSALKAGLVGFAQDDQSKDYGVAAQHFPIGGFTETCDPAAYAATAVPWALLPAPALVTWINSLEAAGYTPSVPALQGAVNACKARMASTPDRKCAVVFVTDGEPEGNCTPVSISAEGPLGEIAADARAHGIPVFAIGFPGISAVGQQILMTIAKKGGTRLAIGIKEGSIDEDFAKALSEVRGEALGCEYQMPTTDAGTVNPELVHVGYTPGNSTQQQTIPRKRTAEDCDSSGGWVYDDNDNPTKLIMCPATCETMQEDTKGKIAISLGCEPNLR